MKIKLIIKKLMSLVLVSVLVFCNSVVAFATEETEYVSEEVARIVEEALNNPETVSFDDVAYAMQQDEKAAKVILDYFSEIATPISGDAAQDSEPTEETEADERNALHETNPNCLETYEYNPKTGKVTYRVEEFDIHEGEPQQTEPILSDDITNTTRDVDPVPFPQDDAKLKTIFKLFIKSQTGGVFSGSAFKVSGKYLATAGHCLYNKQEMGGWAGSILCVPAYRVSNGSGIHPLGESYQVANNMYCPKEWINYTDYGYDWGVLQLQEDLSTGAMGRRQIYYNTDIRGKQVYFAGYPKGVVNMKKMSGSVIDYTMYRATVNEISYDGQSGGPVWDEDGFAIGIISQGGIGTNETYFVKFYPTLYQKLSSLT